LVRHRMGGRVSEFSSQIAPMVFDGSSPWELAVYFQDQWRLVPSVQTELGIRATSFVAEQGSFSAIDPRFSLSISLGNDSHVFSSFSAVTQFVHPYRNSGIFLFYPSIFLYPSSDDAQPSTSLQVSLGLEHVFHEDQYRVAIETYYRMTNKLHEFMYDTVMVSALPEALLLGRGDVSGAEITLEKRLGGVKGMLRYGYSWASNRFDELNGGAAFRPRFDRRHEVYAGLSYSMTENWMMSATALLSANRPQPFDPIGEEAYKATGAPLLEADAARAQYAEPYDLNGGRLPWGLPTSITLRLLNGYGLADPFIWKLRDSPDARLRWRVTFDAPPLFPMYPVVSMGVKF
jgi:hypothetical protein